MRGWMWIFIVMVLAVSCGAVAGDMAEGKINEASSAIRIAEEALNRAGASSHIIITDKESFSLAREQLNRAKYYLTKAKSASDRDIAVSYAQSAISLAENSKRNTESATINVVPVMVGALLLSVIVVFTLKRKKTAKKQPAPQRTPLHKTPAPRAPESSRQEIIIRRGYEVLSNNDIRFGIRITNNTGYVVLDVETLLDFNKSLFSLRGERIVNLGNIPPKSERTAEYILTPLGCIHNERIDATLFYKDHTGEKHTIQMRPKEVHCVCPFLRGKAMTLREFAELAEDSEHLQEGLSFTGISVEGISKFLGEICANRLHLVSEHTVDSSKILYLAGESIGEKAYYLLTAVVQPYKNTTQVALRAYSDRPHGLHGFMKEITTSLRQLIDTVQSAREIGVMENKQVINIIDSVVQRTSFNTAGNGEINIEDSVVRRVDFGNR